MQRITFHFLPNIYSYTRTINFICASLSINLILITNRQAIISLHTLRNKIINYYNDFTNNWINSNVSLKRKIALNSNLYNEIIIYSTRNSFFISFHLTLLIFLGKCFGGQNKRFTKCCLHMLGREGRKATGEEDDATFTIVRSFKIEQSFYEDSCAWRKLRNSGRKPEFFAFYDIIARWVSLTKIFRLQACFLLQWL